MVRCYAAFVLPAPRRSKSGRPAAEHVLDVMRGWKGPRPPGGHAYENRRDMLRLGAWEYASGFDELAQLIDQLLRRRLEATA